MPGMLTLIELGAAAIAFFAFIGWGNSVLKHHYVDPVVAEAKAAKQACTSTIDSQTTTIRTQGESLAGLLKKTGEQSASITRLAEIAKFQGDAADQLRAKAAALRAAVQPRIDADAAAAAGPPSAGTCEQQAANIRQIGDEYAREVFGLTK